MNALLRLFRRRPRHELRHDTALSNIAAGHADPAWATAILAGAILELHDDVRQGVADDLFLRTALKVGAGAIGAAASAAFIWGFLEAAGIVR